MAEADRRLLVLDPADNVAIACRDLEVMSCARMGKEGEHLKLALSSGGRTHTALWWRNGSVAPEIETGSHIDVAFSLEEDTYRGNGAVQMVVEDLAGSIGPEAT